MRADSIEVSGYYRLLALHRALLEAKFNPDPADRDIVASPFVAEIARDVIEKLIEIDCEKPGHGNAQQWREWRQIDPARSQWEVAVKRARDRRDLASCTSEERSKIIHDILAPFEIDSDLEERFIQEAAIDG